MQLRLTLALVATAMAAIVLVGAGVLGLASIGADREAEQRVDSQLDALVDVVEGTGRLRDIGPAIRRFGAAFDGTTIEFGTLRPDGTIRLLQPVANQSAPVDLALDGDDRARLEAGETVYAKVDGRMRGVRRVDVESLEPGGAAALSAIVVETRIDTIGRNARVWFVLSAIIVLLGAALAAAALARRLVRPIRAATEATRTIASGDLAVRVPVSGDDELAELGAGINDMAAELERGRAAEQQFLMSVSHDLRTPLTALRGYGEALEDGTATDAAKAGAVISHHTERLGRLVGDLLDLGKLEARQFRFQRRTVDAAPIVVAAADGAVPRAEERSIAITTSANGPAFVSVDPDRLGQIVGNLIDNALAFAERSIAVDVVTDDGVVIVTVADDGPGIAQEDLPHVFERLYVTKLVPERSEASSGLGLAIVRELTHAMGGTVHASRRANGGTVMVVRFPETTPTGSESEPQSRGDDQAQ